MSPRLDLGLRVFALVVSVGAFVYYFYTEWRDSKFVPELVQLSGVVEEAWCETRSRNTYAYVNMIDEPQVELERALIGECKKLDDLIDLSVSFLIDDERMAWAFSVGDVPIYSVRDYQSNSAKNLTMGFPLLFFGVVISGLLYFLLKAKAKREGT